MKNKTSLAASASNVDSAHDKVVKSRRNLKSKQTLFLLAKTANQEAESEFTKAKEAHEQTLIEKH